MRPWKHQAAAAARAQAAALRWAAALAAAGRLGKCLDAAARAAAAGVLDKAPDAREAGTALMLALLQARPAGRASSLDGFP